MTRRLVLYEDEAWRSLSPLTDLTPVPALTFGASNLAERWRRASALPLAAIVARRAAMVDWLEAPALSSERPDAKDEALVVNSAALPGSWLVAALERASPTLFTVGDRIAAALLPYSAIGPALGAGAQLERAMLTTNAARVAVPAQFLKHPWDVFLGNAEAVAADLDGEEAAIRGDVHKLACLEGPTRIRVERGAVIGPYAVLDARDGPIRIGEGVRVAAHTVVTGPCAVGHHTELLGGRIARSSFGPQCRVAGEVEESVWQGYANKRHHGFVGHSVIGEWVNLGALTTTSDLKNNYGNVRVWVDGAERDSGHGKVGALIGAHVKTGIGTLLPTGASLGTGAVLFGGGRFAPRRVPSFGWWDGERMLEHELEKCIATARHAMSRRGRTLSATDEALLRATFEDSAGERRS